MSRYINGCTCERCRTRGFMGPAILVTLGVLLLLGEFTRWDFGDTWPILLIVIGVVKMLSSSTSTEGHISGYLAYPQFGPPAPTNVPPTGSTGTNPGQVSNG
ncbi:MAG: LiaI-LiaF-like domain-containing protein [Terriglobales bacterium]